jgi:hypothetical protein
VERPTRTASISDCEEQSNPSKTVQPKLFRYQHEGVIFCKFCPEHHDEKHHRVQGARGNAKRNKKNVGRDA